MSNDAAVKVKKDFSKNKYYDLFLNYAIYIFLLILIGAIVAIAPEFLAVRNFEFILTQASTRIIIALGVAGIIIAGGVDLAAGRLAGLAAVVSASLLQSATYSGRIYADMPALPLILPLLLVIVLAVAFSAAQGAVVARFKIDPFITSLGTSLIVYGALSVYYDAVGHSSPIGGLDPRFSHFAQGFIDLGVIKLYYLMIYALIITAIIWFIWNKTKLGKNMYAIGGNPSAAAVSGVNIGWYIVLTYIIAGILYGFAGFLEAGRTGSATNTLGTNYELDAIAACVVGGVSLRGGVGSISGVLIGVLLFQVINYGLVFISVSPYVQYIIKGFIIVLAITVDTQKYLEKK